MANSEKTLEQAKPRITRIVLSRGRVRWVVLLGDKIVGFKRQTQFKHFRTACFIAECLGTGGFCG